MYNHSMIKKCPITNSEEQIKYFDLGDIPLVNNLCDSREESLNVKRFPLNINYYPSSGESSLDFAVDSELLFKHYLFKSEVNVPYIKHCEEMFNFIQKYISIDNNTKILDIGGNDGTLLSTFKKISNINFDVLNIDPSENLAVLAKNKGIPTLVEFFNNELALTLDKKFDIITSTNVFQHLEDINSFVKGINTILSSNGIWVLEFPYWIHNMITNQFDQIYHEHVYYHSITPIKMILENNGLKLINITKQNIHGGTLRLIISSQISTYTPDNSIEMYLQSEKNYDLDYHINWGKQIKTYINESKLFIESLKSTGKTIYGFGAAAKGCIYLNAMELTYEHIDYIIDDTDIKQYKFVPGTGIQILSRDILKTKQPDYILILAHNFSDYIIDSLKKIGYKGKFIILIPEITII